MGVTFQGFSNAERIGEGGFGTLHRAIRDATGEPVAIKELWNVNDGSPIAVRLKRELEALEPLRGNPDIVDVDEIIEGPNGLCLVMQFAAGGSLMNRLSRSPLSPPELVLAGLHASRALAAAHALGIVHGDLKPQNMLIDLFGQVKICDFGIAALFRASNGFSQPDDVLALGATFMQLATGKRPSAGDRVVNPHAGDASPSGATMEADMGDVYAAIQRCLAVDPADRPTMAELVPIFEMASDGIIDATPTALERIGTLPPPIPHLRTARPKSPARLEFERATLESELARRAAIEDELEVSRRHSRNVRRAVSSGTAVAVVLVLAVIVLVVTRSGNDTNTADADAAAAANPATSTAVAFFQAISKPSADALAQAQLLVAPQSPAAAFLYHQQRLFQAHQLDQTQTDSKSFIDGDSIGVCNGDDCDDSVVYSNFQVVADNRLRSFDVDGESLDGAISIWSTADAPCGASYIEALGGTAIDTCDADNLVLVMRSLLRDPSGNWTVTYDWKHGSNWAQDMAYATADQSGSEVPIKLVLASAALPATAWSTSVPAAGTTAVGFAVFEVPEGTIGGAAELTIATVSSDAQQAWGCDNSPVCALGVDFVASPGG